MLSALRSGIRGARGIEFLLIAVAIAVLGMTVLNGALPAKGDSRTDIERRLESVLGAIDGAGKVRVMVSEHSVEVQTAFSMQQSGEQVIRGVLVVAEGAEDLGVRMEIQRAVQALLDVDLSAIEIMGMQGD